MASYYCIGFFGIPNIGDELLCAMVVDALRRLDPDARISLQTQSADVSRTYTGLDAGFVEGFCPDAAYLRNLPRHVRAAREADLLVIGGGGLINDYYTWASLFRYFADVLWAISFGRPYVFVGLGAVGARRRWLRPLVRFVCRHAAGVYCRDAASARRVGLWGSRDDVIVAPDLGHLIHDRLPDVSQAEGPTVVNLREKPPLDPQAVRSMLAALATRGRLVLLAAEHPDVVYYRRLLQDGPEPLRAACRIVEPQTLREAIEHIAGARAVVAERLHVNLIAVHARRPLVALEYEDKVRQLLHETGLEQAGWPLERIGPRVADPLDATPPRADPVRLARLARQAAEALARTLQAGRTAVRYSFGTRAAAAGWLLLVLGVSAAWACGAALKRLLRRLHGRSYRPR